MTAAMIGAHGVSKRFGSTTAVDEVSLTVTGGEVVGLLGANGAGKTTLIRLILGLLIPTAGTVDLFTVPPSRAGRRRLGYVPQTSGMYADLTLDENLGFVAGAFGVDPPDLDDTLAIHRHRTLGDLPLGIRRRAAFVGALAHRPELLVLDEPTSGVGPLGRIELWTTIRTAADTGTGVLVTTHHMEEAAQCDRLVVLVAGRVVAAGTPAEITGDHVTTRVETTDPVAVVAALEEAGLTGFVAGTTVRVPGVDPGTVSGVLRRRGLDVTVDTSPADLDEVFLVLAGP